MAIEVNRHHNVPSSRGGTHSGSNLSLLRRALHDAFHAWAANYSPDTLLRLLAIHAGRSSERALPAGALRDLFGVLMEGEWESLYRSGVVLSSPYPGEKQVLRHLRHEGKDVRGLRDILMACGSFPPDRDSFLGQALTFFKVPSPRDAMQHLLCESYGRDLSWAKALRDDVREKVHAVLIAADPSALPEQQKVIDILVEQECRIAQRIAALSLRYPSSRE